MKIAVPRETRAGECRVAMAPESVKRLIKVGAQVAVEAGAGVRAGMADADYAAVGAEVASDGVALLSSADFVFKVAPPAEQAEIDALREGAMLISSLIPQRHGEIIRKLAQRKIVAFSTDLIPRTTRAQSMDTLSSMANIAGYKAALIGALELSRYFPMFMTAAGTIFAAKVFVIGAGVAGLQAIATARRLGAVVEATDTRSVVKEQIESLGGKYVGVESAEDAQTAAGYAKELSAEFYRKQAELIADRCAASDVVITTALIGGVKAPRLIPADVVARMKPGSVIVDLAAEAGGNCECTRPGETNVVHGVKICAPLNLPSSMPFHSSLLWSRNLTTFALEFIKDGKFNLNLDDDIIKGALVTRDGQVVHPAALAALEQKGGAA